MPLYRLREDDPIATLGELNARPTAPERAGPRVRHVLSPRPLQPAKPASKRAA